MKNIKLSIKNLLKKNDENKSFEVRVKKALDNGEFEAYYQPQYNYNTKQLSGAEALMRWNSPQKGMILPGRFIGKLEKCGLIYEADKVIWEKVLSDLREWKQKGLNIPNVSINISGIDIYHDDFEEYIVNLVEKYGLKPENVHLEITETVYIKDLKYMKKVVSSLQSKGVVVEMDDFGSGYSSLKSLKNVQFNIIKLDMDFLQGSETNERDKNLLTAIVGMIKKIKIPIIVEGVECEEQAEFLNNLGCKYMQGYYFGKPVSKAEFEEVLKKG